MLEKVSVSDRCLEDRSFSFSVSSLINLPFFLRILFFCFLAEVVNAVYATCCQSHTLIHKSERETTTTTTKQSSCLLYTSDAADDC